MRDYELTFVVRPDIDDKAVKAAAERVQGLITQRGGEISNIQEWGKRRLAYHIQHHVEGSYFVYRLRMEPSAAAEIEHELNLDEQVLRFIMVYLTPVALEALKNPPAPMAPRPERREPVEVEAPPAVEPEAAAPVAVEGAAPAPAEPSVAAEAAQEAAPETAVEAAPEMEPETPASAQTAEG